MKALLVSVAIFAAWDPDGHRTVAAIAWDRMTPRARTRAIALLTHGPQAANLGALRPRQGTDAERDRGLFMNAATWADLVRARGQIWSGYNRPTWHYADFYWDLQNGAPHALRGPDPVNAGERIAAFRAVLVDSTVADSTKALALAWLLHLVGDIHQPLHCSSRVTLADPLPGGDRGGNLFLLDGHNNLHRYWDGIVTMAAPLAPSEDSAAYATRTAQRIEQTYPANQPASADVATWEQEGLRVAQALVYDSLTRGVAPSAAYERRALATAEDRMALAGVRLADLLDAAFN